MARDGSGTYNRPVSDYVFNTVISETDVNTEMDQIATALTDSIAKDGQTTPTANLPMGAYRHTNVGNASARNDYAAAGQVQDGAFIWCGTAGGTKNALTLTPTPAITAYAAGQRFRFKAGSTASDDAVTIAVSGLATKAAEIDDAALSASVVIEANKYYEALYDGTAFQLTRLSSAPALTISDKTGSDAGVVSGTAGTNGNWAAWNADGDLVDGGGVPIEQGKHTIWIPSAAMRPTVSNGCASLTDVETTAGRPDLQVLDFDASSDEHAQFQISFPDSWDEGTITFQVFWTSTATDTDGVTWALQGVAVSDGGSIDVAYGTAVTVDDANQSTAEDLYVTAESGAVTIGGTPAAGDICYFRIFRDVSDANDTAAEDARLIGVKVFYTVNAADDS